MIRNFETKAKT